MWFFLFSIFDNQAAPPVRGARMAGGERRIVPQEWSISSVSPPVYDGKGLPLPFRGVIAVPGAVGGHFFGSEKGQRRLPNRLSDVRADRLRGQTQPCIDVSRYYLLRFLRVHIPTVLNVGRPSFARVVWQSSVCVWLLDDKISGRFPAILIDTGLFT